MKTLQNSRSLPYYLDELTFTEAALNAAPEASSLAPPCTALVAGWFPLLQTERESRHDVTRACAVLRVKTQMFDMGLRRFCGMALVEANQDRESVFFRRFFPASLSVLARQPLSKQVDFVRNAIAPELDKLDDGHALKAYKEPLLKAAGEVLDAIESKKRVSAARTSVSRDIEEWKMQVNAFRMSVFGELLKIASANGYPRTWADGFFRAEPGSAENGSAESDAETEGEPIQSPAAVSASAAV